MKSSSQKQFGIVAASSILALLFLAASPALTLAQSSSSGSLTKINNINGLTTRLASIGTATIYMLTGLAVVYIVWATVQYFIKGKEGDESRRAAGMQILWGIVGLAIILSLWGLVNVLLQTFGTNTSVTAKLPQANFVTNGTAQ